MRSQERQDMKPQQQTTSDVERRENGGRRCKVIFSYNPQHEDELSLCEGDVINVLQEVEEGWWKGLLKGKIGMFPSNFVEECDQGEESRANIYSMEPRNTEINGNPQISDTALNSQKETNGIQPSANSAFHPVNYSKTIDVSSNATPDSSSKVEGDSMENKLLQDVVEREKITISIGDKKLKSNETNLKSKLGKTTVNNAFSQPSPPQLPPKPVREMARVLYPYTAEHEDELELIEGDLITILNKDLEDKGWWKGEIGGKVGVFPDNFVQIISHEETVKPPRPEKRPAASISKVMRTSSSSIVTEKEPSLPPAFLPPPLPNKKGSPPPLPTVKKPLPPPDNFIKTLNGTEVSSSEPNSLTLSRETHLTHVQRPKGPSNRRPPSHILKENKNSITTEDDVFSSEEDSSMMKTDSFSEEFKTESDIVPDEPPKSDSVSSTGDSTLSSATETINRPPWFKELRDNQKKRMSDRFSQSDIDVSTNAFARGNSPGRSSPSSAKSSPKLESPLKDDVSDGARNRGMIPSSAVVKAPVSNAPITAPREMQRSFVNGTDSSLSSRLDSIYLEVTAKVRSLETRLEEQNTKHLSQMQQLTRELDEERMARACLQIEVDRLKKLLTAQYAHV